MYDVEAEVGVSSTTGTGPLLYQRNLTAWLPFPHSPLSPTSCHPGYPSSNCQGEACWANRVAGTVCSHLLQCRHHLK